MIRKAGSGDLNDIMNIYSHAREFMKATGNPTQWGSTYPEKEILQEDILKKRLYVFDDNGIIRGAFVYFEGEEPLYQNIEGAWNDTSPYGVIHRVAKGEGVKGFLEKMLQFINKQHLRIDTHTDNLVMQHVLEKHGFVRCGIIHLENGDPRIAYERT